MVYTKKQISMLLEKVAKRMTSIDSAGMQEGCPISIINFETWEWAQGVGMYGLYKFYEETGSKEHLEFLTSWYDRRIKEGLPEKNVNTMSPMLTLAHLCEVTGNESWLELCKEWAAWVMYEMPRTEEGGLQHVISGGLNDGQLWDDTLFMTVLFLAKMGRILDREDYLEESVRQFLVHIKYLYDKNSGLWFHGWTFNGRHNFADALWARGNCWYTAGVVDYIEMIDLRGGVRQYLLDTLNAQVRKLEEIQEADGMWHTLLDDPNSYVETSATAGFGYGILKAVRNGYIDPKYLEIGKKALNAVLQRIDDNGTVQQVSYGTGMGKDLDFYRNIDICPMTYGQALAIMLLSEGMKL